MKTYDVTNMVPVSTNELRVLMSMYEHSKVILMDIASGQFLHEIKLQDKPRSMCIH